MAAELRTVLSPLLSREKQAIWRTRSSHSRCPRVGRQLPDRAFGGYFGAPFTMRSLDLNLQHDLHIDAKKRHEFTKVVAVMLSVNERVVVMSFDRYI
jgi:hypothetical protein